MDEAMDDAAFRARLAPVLAKRGYLLPHHGFLALTAPRLLEAYDALYAAMALERRVLSEHDREFVWLAILVAVDEALATHHVAKFKAAGGTDAEIEAALAATALGLGVSGYHFVRRCWAAHLPGLDAERAYLDALERARGAVPMRLVHLALAAVQACRADAEALRWQLRAAYADGVPEAELAEALTLTMFPGSVPYFIDALAVWRDLILGGEVAPSPAFRMWAELPGQGGFDEAARGHGR
jgi:alkylhydroperoxidase/carboxymuconolactone decarboxylase family protein YurZ